MPENSIEETSSRLASVAQFSLREFLMFPTIVGLLLAILVPGLRGQPPELGRRLMWVAIIWIFISVGAMVFLFLKRWRRESHGGKLLLRPRRSAAWIEKLPALFLLLVSSGLIALVFVANRSLLIEILELEESVKQEAGTRLPAFVANLSWPFSIISAVAITPLVMLLAYSLTLLWWKVSPSTLEIREHGVGIGAVNFLRWEEVESCVCLPKKTHRAVFEFITIRRKKHFAVVPLDSHTAVQTLLQDKLIATNGELNRS